MSDMMHIDEFLPHLLLIYGGLVVCYCSHVSAVDAGLGVSISDDDNNNERELFDRTNMFHWCPTQSLEDATLVSN